MWVDTAVTKMDHLHNRPTNVVENLESIFSKTSTDRS